MPKDLYTADLKLLDQTDLRVLLDKMIGGPGQYDGNSSVLHIPLARDPCRISLQYKGSKITGIFAGKAFDPAQWEAIKTDIHQLIHSPPTVGRDISFCGKRVEGWWRGTQSGIQSVPPPEGAPSPDWEIADHPFVFEFPIQDSGFFEVKNLRRRREHRSYCRLLNLLLTAKITFPPDRHRSLWARVPKDENMTPRWVQEFYSVDFGNIFADQLSTPKGRELQAVPASQYYEEIGHDGRGLRVPDDLDETLVTYQKLSRDHKSRFDRALYWLSLSSRQWEESMSASFASLVATVESLLERSETHTAYCEKCKKDKTHEASGPTEKFRDFFEQYASGLSQTKRRNQMYELRSSIVHGSNLMQLDQNRDFGWDPPWWNERELHSDLWTLIQVAMRNWLVNPS